jgi:hypothetical protein
MANGTGRSRAVGQHVEYGKYPSLRWHGLRLLRSLLSLTWQEVLKKQAANAIAIASMVLRAMIGSCATIKGTRKLSPSKNFVLCRRGKGVDKASADQRTVAPLKVHLMPAKTGGGQARIGYASIPTAMIFLFNQE